MNLIALFGTSADPPTAGHHAILSWLLQQFDQVAVWAADNPFKSQQTPLFHRVAMMKLLIDEIRYQFIDPSGHISYYPELSHPRSFHTVQRARDLWPNGQFSLVIGSDLIHQLPDWYQIQDLLSQVRLLIIPRPNHGITPREIHQLEELRAWWSIAQVTGLWGSSSIYRQAGESSLITPAIAQYIHDHSLYQESINHRR